MVTYSVETTLKSLFYAVASIIYDFHAQLFRCCTLLHTSEDGLFICSGCVLKIVSLIADCIQISQSATRPVGAVGLNVFSCVSL